MRWGRGWEEGGEEDGQSAGRGKAPLEHQVLHSITHNLSGKVRALHCPGVLHPAPPEPPGSPGPPVMSSDRAKCGDHTWKKRIAGRLGKAASRRIRRSSERRSTVSIFRASRSMPVAVNSTMTRSTSLGICRRCR